MLTLLTFMTSLRFAILHSAPFQTAKSCCALLKNNVHTQQLHGVMRFIFIHLLESLSHFIFIFSFRQFDTEKATRFVNPNTDIWWNLSQTTTFTLTIWTRATFTRSCCRRHRKKHTLDLYFTRQYKVCFLHLPLGLFFLNPQLYSVQLFCSCHLLPAFISFISFIFYLLFIYFFFFLKYIFVSICFSSK